ncbi:MAG: PAS domain-containing protein [Bacillota bacterium]
MIEIVKNYMKNFFVDEAKKYNNELQAKVKLKNIKRMKNSLIFIAFLTFIVFILQFLTTSFSKIFYYQSGVLVTVLVLIYLYYKNTSNENKINKIEHNDLFLLSIIFLLLWPAIRAGYFKIDNFSLSLYIITLFFISAVFYFKWKRFLILAGFTTFIIWALNYIFASTAVILSKRFLLLLNVYILSFIISRVNYLSLLDNVVKLKETEAEYKSIIDKNKRLETMLEKKNNVNSNLQNEINKLKDKFSYILEKSNSGFWEWEIDKDKVIYNKEWAKILDYHVNKLDGRLETWKDLIHPDDSEDFDELITNIKNGEIEKFSYEHRLKTGTGKWKWMLAEGKIVETDEEGKGIKAEGIHLDIDKIKNLEKDLKYCNNKFDSIFNSLPFSLMLYKDDSWVYINDYTEKLLGYSKKELLNNYNWNFIDSKSLKEIRANDLAENNDFNTLKIITKNKEKKLVDVYLNKIDINGEEMIIFMALKKS